MGTTYDTNSADCPATFNGTTLSLTVGSMGSGTEAICKFDVKVTASPSRTAFKDDIESGADKWAVSHGAGAIDWGITNNHWHSPDNSWFAADINTVSDQYLTLASPILINGDSFELIFWHDYNAENTFDGGVVEISTDDGATWIDLGPQMTENGYNGTISTSFGSPIGGRMAFTNDSGGFIKTTVDLSSFDGESILIRFRFATDTSVADEGWYVDDVYIVDARTISNKACVTAAQGDNDCSDTVVTRIEGSASSFPMPISVPGGGLIFLPF